MIETKKTFTDAQFIPLPFSVGEKVFFIIFVLFMLFSPYILPFIYTTPSNGTSPDIIVEMARGIGIFFQLHLILTLVNILPSKVLLLVYGIIFPSKNKDFRQNLSLRQNLISPFGKFRGKFKGTCPYCGAFNEVEFMDYRDKRDKFRDISIDCPNCKNRFLLKNGKFFQQDPPSPLDARFSCVKNGLGLVRIAIIAAYLALGAFIIRIIGAILIGLIGTIPAVPSPTINIFLIIISSVLLPIPIFIIVFLIVSVAVQIAGTQQCLQAPDWSPGKPVKTWIIAAMYLQVITLMLLFGQLLLTLKGSNAFLMDALLGISGFLYQFAFFVFLIRLCNFIQRADLGDELWGLFTFLPTLTISLIFFVPLAELALPSYKTPLVFLLALMFHKVFSAYFFSLGRLNSHISQALTTYNYGASSRN